MMTSTLAPVYANEVDLDITGLLDEGIDEFAWAAAFAAR